MNELIKLSVKICVLIMLVAVACAVTDGLKCGKAVRSAVFVTALAVAVSFCAGLDFKNKVEFLPESIDISEHDVWDSALTAVEKQLESEMKELCEKNGLSIDGIEADLGTDYSDVEVKSVRVYGRDAQKAKSLIAGYFNIGLAYISIDGE